MGERSARSDDNLQILRLRFHTYNTETAKTLQLMSKFINQEIYSIDTTKTVETITENILKLDCFSNLK